VVPEDGNDTFTGTKSGKGDSRGLDPIGFSMVDEVSGQNDQVRGQLVNMADGLVEVVHGNSAKVKITELDDAEAVEVTVEVGNRHGPADGLNPGGFDCMNIRSPGEQ
jgi:hypothetical protein